jgi:hypothetical protein
MRHRRVLEDAGLVSRAGPAGRSTISVNPVPVRLVHDRWIDKYTEHPVSPLTDLETELGGRA